MLNVDGPAIGHGARSRPTAGLALVRFSGNYDAKVDGALVLDFDRRQWARKLKREASAAIGGIDSNVKTPRIDLEWLGLNGECAFRGVSNALGDQRVVARREWSGMEAAFVRSPDAANDLAIAGAANHHFGYC